ncbi:hypothetical protein [Streptomyces sp. NPDC047706]|uniref:hypothetical protein n=1 Tax=Streptomyces sp. NPDC047706 TaxID=3365486 RepID=UPI00371A904B
MALAGDVTASALSVSTLCAGPVARALAGVDLVLRAGLVVASARYATLADAARRRA